MIDKYIKLTTSSGSDVSKNIQGQIQQPQKVSGGVEGFKKEQGLKMKKGGNVNMEYAKKERRQQAFEDRQKKNRAKGKLKAIKFGKKLKKITQIPKDLTDQFFGFVGQAGKSLVDEVTEKKPISKKEGGFIAKGCGKVMSNRRKKTRMY